MKLKSLEIRLQASYEDNPGKYQGVICFEGQAGNVKLLLDPDLSAALLGFIGDTVVKFSETAARQLQDSIALSVQEARQAPALEAPKV